MTEHRRFVIKIAVSGRVVESCLLSALGSVACGCGYWASVGVDDDGTPLVRDRLADPLGPWVRLDDAAIVRGLALLVEAAPKTFGRLLSVTDADGPVGDALIQCAVLGQLKYG